MALKNVLSTSRSGPYEKPPALHLRVLLTDTQPKVLQWNFKEDTAIPVVSKKNKVAVVTDGDSLAKITLFEEYADKMQENNNYIMQGYSLRGHTHPRHILVTKKTQFFRSFPVVCRNGLMEEARALLHPPSLQTTIKGTRGYTGLLTVEGRVIQLSAVRKARSGKEEVPVREIELQEGDDTVTVVLWREAATELQLQLELGTQCRISHIKASRDEVGGPLHSSAHTTIEMLTATEEEEVQVVGWMEGAPGSVELFLSDERKMELSEEMWRPYEPLLSERPLEVCITHIGRCGVKISQR